MSVIGKSNHPVQIKRIKVLVWTLRDEIEKAIELKVKEEEKPIGEINIDEIKDFYNLKKHPVFDQEEKKEKPAEENKDEDQEKKEEQEDSSESDSEAAEENTDEESEDSAETSEDSESEEEPAFKERFKSLDEGTKRFVYSPKRVRPNQELIAKGFALMSDMSMDEILLFLNKPFTYGQSIIVEFLIPNSFCLSADVTYSSNFAMRSRIISEDKPEYRVKADWTFLMKGERTTLRNFLASIEPEMPVETPKKAAASDADDDDDDFSDLGL